MRNVTSGLTSTAIKTIALLLMVIDHVYYFFNFTGVVPTWYNIYKTTNKQGKSRGAC